MSSDRTNSRTNPMVDTGRSEYGMLLPGAAEVKVCRSWQDVQEHLQDSSTEREVLVIEVDKNAESGGQRPIHAELDRLPQDLPSPDVANAQSEGSSTSTRNRSFVEQQLVRLVYLEFRRVNVEVSINRQVNCLDQRLQSLSSRELDVLILTIQGKTCKEVAAKMEVGLATAAKHRGNVFKKLGVRNGIELVHLLSAHFISERYGNKGYYNIGI